MSRVPDQADRDAALDIGRSFIVQAPAGSGKTALLVERYLRLLAAVEKPEELVAITFTKKAAAEMRKRVLERIAPELAPRLRIQTIDALCASVTARMPVLARFGAQPRIAEEPALLYREAAARTLAQVTPPVARLLAHLDNNFAGAAELLAAMLERRDQWLRSTGQAPTRVELEATLALERERLVGRARALHPAASPELAAEVLTQRGEWRKRPAAPADLVAVPGLREALVALLAAPPAAYSDSQWETLESILALLHPAVAQLRVLFAERGEVDFTEVAHAALTALGTPEAPTDLLLAMDARVRHLLVDEFQDTSNSQWELLERLTAGWEPGDGRTLFVVGDPMQSIYRFRDAQVGLFLRARRDGLPNLSLERLRLATNFRSQGAIVGWVNAAFPGLLPAEEDEASGAVPYSPSVAFHERDDEGAPAIELFGARDAEARRVVELVAAARGRTAILVRNRGHLDAIVPALKAAGLPFRAVEIEQLGERQAVQDLYALTRALTHPADRIAWLALLRSPLCGATSSELAAFFEGARDRTVWEAAREAPRFARLAATLRPALEDRLRGSLRARVEGVWLALGGPAALADATELEDIEVFLDELERLEVAGELEDFGALERSLSRLFALPDVAAGPEAVEIMTIHKAKGLEFDTVIVPGLDRAPRHAGKPLFAWRSLPGGRLLLAPIDETGGQREPLYAYVRQLDREAEDIEAGRLFYVAATRAESRLHLLGCVKLDADGVLKPPSKRSLLGLAWATLGEALRLPPAAPASAAAPAPVAPPALRRLPADFEIPPPPAGVEWRGDDTARGDSAIEFAWVGETARHVGTVVHRWLQGIAEDAMRGWDAGRVAALAPRARLALAALGVPGDELDAATARVLDALTRSIADERGRWLLGGHPRAASEHRLVAMIDRVATRLVIDRYFETDDGERWVVDYKTSSHSGAGVDAFLDRERERYAGQLMRYVRAMELDGRGRVRAGLYFPLLGGWREVERA